MRKASWILAAEKVEGDYLEFGVYRGGSLIKAYREMESVYEEQMRESGGRSKDCLLYTSPSPRD